MNSKIFVNTLYSYVNQYGCNICKNLEIKEYRYIRFTGSFKISPCCYIGEEEKLLDPTSKNQRVFKCHNFVHNEEMYFNSKFMWLFNEGVDI